VTTVGALALGRARDRSAWGTRAVGVVLVAGWAAISFGAAFHHGAYGGDAVVFVSVGTALLLALVAGRLTPAVGHDRVVAVAAGLAVAGGVLYPEGVDGAGAAYTVSRVLTDGAVGAVALWLVVGLPWGRVVSYAVIGLMSGAALCLVVSSPRPAIDVWFMLQAAGAGLTHHRDLYTLQWTSGQPFEQSNGFAYLPGAAVVLWPFQALAGDVRYGLLAAVVVTALLLVRVRARSHHVLVGTFVLLSPSALFGLEQSWIDPLVLLAVCATAYAVVRGRTGWAVAAFAAALACKQQAWLFVPLALGWRGFGWRRTWTSAALAGVFVAPWVITDPGAFYRGAIAYNLHLPPRADSLSLFRTAMLWGWQPAFGVIVAATLAAVALALWRLPRDTYGFLLGSASVMAVFNLSNKQTFFNEWALAAGLALAAMVFFGADERLDSGAPCSGDGARVPAPVGPSRVGDGRARRHRALVRS